jgi:hypothetical protein
MGGGFWVLLQQGIFYHIRLPGIHLRDLLFLLGFYSDYCYILACLLFLVMDWLEV